MKGQLPATVAAAKTPLPQATKPVIREQLPAIAKIQTANAAAITPTVKPTQVNKADVNHPRQEQKTVPDAAAEQPGTLLAENTLEEPQPTVKAEVEPANAAATIVTEVTAQSVSGGQQPERETTMPADAAAPPIPSTDASTTQAMVMTPEKPTNAAASIPAPQASQRPMANGQPPTRPLIRRGPAGRTMPGKRPSAMPPVVKQQVPVAAAIPVIPTTLVSRPNNSVQQTGQVYPKATVMAEAIYGADEQPLRYRNGVLVDRTNAAEVEAFRQYEAEKRGTPLSRPQLRTYMRQKLAT